MATGATSLIDATAAEKSAAIEDAVEALRDGQLVILPTETVYGVAASARMPESLEALGGLCGRDDWRGPWTWHAPSRGAITHAWQPSHPNHRRLLDRLTPGPLTLLIERTQDEAATESRAIGVPEGTLHADSCLCLRLPDHPVAREVLERVGDPVVIEGLSAVGWGGPGGGDTLDHVPPDAGITALDAGRTRLHAPSAQVRLSRHGGVDVLREGALRKDYIMRQTHRVILFVCTGNTCRSPMAEALARHELEGQATDGVSTRVGSAGVSASDGAPMTPEAREALQQLEVPVEPHRSRLATRELLASADEIYVMTENHRQLVLRLDPTARVSLLDPEGGDIADPIGYPLPMYVETAQHMRTLIRQRLQELAI